MKKNICIILFGLLLSIPVFADCNFKKATRNKMLDEKIGISGKCNTEKFIKNKITDSANEIINVNTLNVQPQIINDKNKVMDATVQTSALPSNNVSRGNKTKKAHKK
ncbi:hypothetical protein GKR59_01270 [Providencia alcalifaciens]|uniref:hypothetical protein n=1 Tax=Providencia TaxID=586 RepID=UPI0012B6286C|nr:MULTISPECIES: hypothetical protein [Providencia]MTC48286.1 hypothetical protein [Providencia alcalifaciens]